LTPILMLCVGQAEAFVGAFVAPEGVVVEHHHAAAVVFRTDSDDGVVTLTSEVTGGAQHFAWIVPMVGTAEPEPEAVSADDFAELDAWTAPQLVQVTCEDLFPFVGKGRQETGADDRPATGPRSRGKGPWGCGGSQSRGPRYYDYSGGYYPRGDTAQYGGRVEPVLASVAGPEFMPTDWTFTVVDGADLIDGLDAAGLSVSEALESDLAKYLSAGHPFVVAEASLESPADGRWLQPFQFQFKSALSPLLVRPGVSTSDGEQDLVIITLEEGSLKGVEVNYEPLAPETDCLVDSVEAFSGFYENELSEAFGQLTDDAGGAGWFQEYEAAQGANEAGDSIDKALLTRFGRTSGLSSSFVLTRSRVRYDPTRIEKDPALSTNPDFGSGHVRYVLHDESLESNFPTCNVPFPVDPGSCFDDPPAEPDSGRGAMAGIGVIVAGGALWRAMRRHQRY
jgi:hypothetical protein